MRNSKCLASAFGPAFSYVMVIAASAAIVSLGSSCSSAKKTPVIPGGPGQPKAVVPTAAPIEIAKSAKDATALIARPVTSLGDNRAPRFSADGSKLLFLSSGRPSHRQAQVYELDLLRMTERRVTFHDGDDEGASWAGAKEIVYSSVTDEMKENVSLARIKAVYDSSRTADTPNGMRPAPRIVNGGDIYRQRLDGREIERLTEISGPDVSPTSDGRRVVFVSSRTGDPRLFLLNGSSLKPITHGPDFAPAFSLNGKSLVWQRSIPLTDSKAPAQFQLMMSENLHEGVPLTSPGFNDQQPQWSGKGDSVVFASNRSGSGKFDLYLIDRKGSCLKRITQGANDSGWPAMSPDGSKIAFVAKANGQNQIYLMDDRTASLTCATSEPAKP